MKTSDCYLLGVFLFGCLIAQSYGIKCECNDTVCLSGDNVEQCCDWVPQPIDLDVNSLNDPDGTPYGYFQMSLPGGESDDPQPCVTFTFPPGSGTRYLTVPVYIGNGINICADTVEITNVGGHPCGTDVGYFCRDVNSQSVDIYFGCEDGCPGTDVAGTIFFRGFFNITSGNIEDFCENYEPTLPLPNDLILPPTVGSVDVGIPTNPDGASRLLSLYSPLLLLIALVAKLLATW